MARTSENLTPPPPAFFFVVVVVWCARQRCCRCALTIDSHRNHPLPMAPAFQNCVCACAKASEWLEVFDAPVTVELESEDNWPAQQTIAFEGLA